MKKVLIFFAITALVAVSCEPKGPVTVEFPVQLMLDGQPFAQEGVQIVLAGGDATFEGVTSAAGSATFTVPVGMYNASASFKKSEAGILYNYNGSVIVTVSAETTGTINLPITASKSSQLILKEVYNGGCQKNGNTGNFAYDKYVIIYNNSDVEVDASKMCLAMAQISSKSSMNNYATADGGLEYEKEGWTPASYGVWWFQKGVEVKIAPYSQIVISICGAVDHTQTHENSVDLSKADFCLYDLESGFNNATNWYPAPSASIPTSHYMKTYEYGMGTAWVFPNQMAAPFILMAESDIESFVKDPANFSKKTSNNSGNFAKIPTSWVLDALDVWPNADETQNFLRFPSTVNVGYQVLSSSGLGYTFYRNVDKAATEAIPENEGKLVTGYAGAVDASNTDPSGIDAEASIAKGAKIVFMDTNNSSKDFHLRKFASLKN